MSLSSVSIRRPVLSIVLSILILLFGFISYTFLGVREFPSIDPPVITVSVSYVGANAEVIESQITEPLEESINGIAGIRSLTSVSRDGRCNITVEFNIEIDLEAAANDVRDRVSRAINQLPPDIDQPTVTKADADAFPIIFINILSDKKSLLQLSDIANNIFKERLQTVPGVSQVQIWGEKRYSMRLWLDPLKMASLRVTPQDVRNALNTENVELPSGKIEGFNTELTIRTKGKLTTEEEFNNLIVREDRGVVIRFSDIGYAQLGPENENSILKRNGIPMVGCAVIPLPGSNQIQIADEVYKRLAVIQKELSEDVQTGIGFDVTRFIRQAITEVQETLFIAFMLVILVIFVFLRDWRTTLIPNLAIPVSLIGTFFIMYIAGFTINVLTMLGLVLAIGIVVDDAIVVMENIYKKIEDGMDPYEAGIKGSAEIFFAIISTTVVLAAVFLPIIFLQGLTGRLFREFGVVIAGSVLISSFVALTLTPMMSTRLLKGKLQHNKLYNVTEPFFSGMVNVYTRWLDYFLHHRYIAIVIMGFSILMIVLVAPVLKEELAPLSDRSQLRLQTTTAEGSSFTFTSQFIDKLAMLVDENVPEADAVISGAAAGGGGGAVNSGFIRLVLTDPEQRTRTQQEIAEELGSKVRKLNDGRTFVIQEQSITTQRGGLPVQYVIQATSIEKLRSIIPKFLEEAGTHPSLALVDVNLKFTKPELTLEINRTKAKELGVSVLTIAQTLQLALSGQRYGFFIMNGKQYQVIGQVAKHDRSAPVDLSTLYVRTKTNDLVQLDDFISISERSTPPQLYRYNRYVSATVSASLAPGKTVGDGIKAMDEVADKLLDDTYSTALSGVSKDFVESSSTLIYTFLFAMVLIYLVLAAQFESFRDPFIIMLTVPLAISGALISLLVFDQTMNIFSEIGQIMLIGLVTKNGILIVEFANQKKASGLSVAEAVREAAILRFRPILMTSISTILGTLPIALALGAGSESRVSMGIAVVGGMIFSTTLTLFVIPAMYTYLSEKTKSVSNVAVENSKTEE
ncbi:MAG: efflux RND transporter permease subunit [Ignavibacteriaceae bacterium]|nr:efflux RND transporter permease subunit [Ignavibacteriaceae bacterium]